MAGHTHGTDDSARTGGGCCAAVPYTAVEVEGNSYYSENTISTWVQRDRLSVNTLYILVKYDFMDAELPAGVERLNVSKKMGLSV